MCFFAILQMISTHIMTNTAESDGFVNDCPASEPLYDKSATSSTSCDKSTQTQKVIIPKVHTWSRGKY